MEFLSVNVGSFLGRNLTFTGKSVKRRVHGHILFSFGLSFPCLNPFFFVSCLGYVSGCVMFESGNPFMFFFSGLHTTNPNIVLKVKSHLRYKIMELHLPLNAFVGFYKDSSDLFH